MQIEPGDTFSKDELRLYSRHLSIPNFDLQGQSKLRKSRVLIVGAGGLGCPMLMYLAAAGIGTLGIVDFDTVDLSNLQRQVLYSQADIGRLKVDVVKEKLEKQNPFIQVVTHNVKLTKGNALDILRSYDVIADGTDNFPARYLINDACIILGKPLVYGSIFQFEGQVSVFNQLFSSGSRGPNYRDLFPEPPPPGMVPSCAESGVLGVLPGIIGGMQASEVIKLLTSIGETLSGRLFVFDALTFTSLILTIRKRSDFPRVSQLIDYDDFCGLSPGADDSADLPSITARELSALQASAEEFQLIDVREPYEREITHLGGLHLPLSTVDDRLSVISRSKKVIVYCRSGQRSARIVQKLREEHHFDNVYNLYGGILSYIDEVDPLLPTY
ncbi:MAG: molybdopterin-synthase adenylyltransferase MoeB [Saprospiraceae bacterium]|nr:molybdopterin-synthase adenylyltransferase MoeB [Saprospiraceae bacterium]